MSVSESGGRGRFSRLAAGVFSHEPAKEDYSLRYAPPEFRRWAPWKVYVTAIGALAAMAGYTLGADYAIQWGFTNALLGTLLSDVLIVLTALPVAVYIARNNIDIDLLTRGAGFGYLGSTVTSLIYAMFTLIFVAFEGAIMAQAVEAVTGLEIRICYVLVSVALVPLVIYGMTFTNKFQIWTQPLWIALVLLGVFAVAVQPGALSHWIHFSGNPGKFPGTSVAPLAVGAITAGLLSGVAQIGEQGDYLRFMPARTEENRRSWWLAVLFGGPGWILIIVFAFLAGTLLASYAAPRVPAGTADVPVTMFREAFAIVVGHGELSLLLAAGLVVLSQLKINIMNAYSGSLSWSNFFSRVLHRHPGRVVWVVFQIGLGLVIMEAGIFGAITVVLALYSNLAVAWIGCLVSDLVINRRLLKFDSEEIEFKRAHLHNFNPVGFGSMLVASAASIAAYFGAFGPQAAQLSSFVALGLALVLPPLVALATRGRYYVARRSSVAAGPDGLATCTVCREAYVKPDMADCPFHGGAICSLCCSTEARCHDACKALVLVENILPARSGPPRQAEVAVEEG